VRYDKLTTLVLFDCEQSRPVLRLVVLVVCVLKRKNESWHGRETGWPNCTCDTDAPPLSGS
jgi:hypothetical protein